MDCIRAAVGRRRHLARVLWDRLDARRAAAERHCRPLAGQRAVVVGAGPVGLRCALELHMLGAQVVVLERRLSFDRINRLHLWPWCGEDLKTWGAKALEPPDLSFGADPDYMHIGIAELQMLLFKSCLLLGVQVFFGAEYSASHAPGTPGSSWSVTCKTALGPDSSPRPGPLVPERFDGVTILVGADGPRGSVAHSQRLERIVAGHLRKEAALGLVANFHNRQTPAEKSSRSFSLCRQFYGDLFLECELKTGLALENIVYYVAAETHYFVMTPTRKSLVAMGVIQDAAEGEALSTLDEAALAGVARKVVAFPWKCEQPALPEKTLDSPVGTAQLFDFSKTRRAASGFRVIGSPPASMLVGLVGDALLEPFWPEGLGIMRGFFAVLDFASACKVWAETRSQRAAEAHFDEAFRQLKSLAAKTRSFVLRPDERLFDLEPSTRYKEISSTGGLGFGSVGRATSVPAFRLGK